MKRLFLLCLCCFLLSACSRTSSDATASPQPQIPLATATEAHTEAASQSFLVYRGDDNAEFFLSEEVFVTEINEAVVTEQLIAAGILSEDTAVTSIHLEGTELIIDFNQAFADRVCSMGTSGERIIVGSTVNTFLSAYSASSVRFTVNGEILESGHVIYDFPLEFMQ